MPLSRTVAESLAAAFDGLRYGSVQLTIHDGHIVRIERLERIRLPAAPEMDSVKAAQAGLTELSEALLPLYGQPTAPTEVRHVDREG